jgi:hypothetical protein
MIPRERLREGVHPGMRESCLYILYPQLYFCGIFFLSAGWMGAYLWNSHLRKDELRNAADFSIDSYILLVYFFFAAIKHSLIVPSLFFQAVKVNCFLPKNSIHSLFFLIFTYRLSESLDISDERYLYLT